MSSAKKYFLFNQLIFLFFKYSKVPNFQEENLQGEVKSRLDLSVIVL